MVHLVSLRRRGPGLRSLRALFRGCIAFYRLTGGLPCTCNTAAKQLWGWLLKGGFLPVTTMPTSSMDEGRFVTIFAECYFH
jgi:hypothetical protein